MIVLIIQYSLRLIEEADACTSPGEVARLLDREGIYSSTLADFRKQKARGLLTCKQQKGSSPKASGSETLWQLAAAEREIRSLLITAPFAPVITP